MVSLTDAEWLTVFFGFVALLVFVLTVLLVVWALVYSLEEEELLAAPNAVQHVPTNLVLHKESGQLRRQDPTEQQQRMCVVDVGLTCSASSSSSSSSLTSSAASEGCFSQRALLPPPPAQPSQATQTEEQAPPTCTQAPPTTHQPIPLFAQQAHQARPVYRAGQASSNGFPAQLTGLQAPPTTSQAPPSFPQAAPSTAQASQAQSTYPTGPLPLPAPPRPSAADSESEPESERAEEEQNNNNNRSVHPLPMHSSTTSSSFYRRADPAAFVPRTVQQFERRAGQPSPAQPRVGSFRWNPARHAFVHDANSSTVGSMPQTSLSGQTRPVSQSPFLQHPAPN